jgi:AcrR family transcriptional regulator
MKSSEEQGDLRVRRTHKLLWEALMAELSARSFEEITVTDICERAMVHRTTFYKHYEDKYALLEQGMRQMYEALLAEGHKPPSAFSADDPPPYFIRLFEHVAQHQHFYKLMLCGDGVARFQKLIKEYIAELALAKACEVIPGNQHFAFPLVMQMHGFAGAVLGLLTWWLEHDMPLAPRQMAHYLLTLHGTLSHHT